MAAKMVTCAKLGKELPGIDPDTPEGNQAARVALLLGGPEMRQRILDAISMQAWGMWTDHMRMVMNEFRLDPTSDEATRVLGKFMNDFLFGDKAEVPNWTPPAAG
jgi:Fe-S cluster biosynthesis and repair protein YggX